MRLIDADKLCEGRVSNDPVVIAAKCSPTVDAEPVRHGRWIQVDEDTWQCSACGVLWTFIDGGPEDNGARHCPVCGAKMDGGADDD